MGWWRDDDGVWGWRKDVEVDANPVCDAEAEADADADADADAEADSDPTKLASSKVEPDKSIKKYYLSNLKLQPTNQK